MANEKTPTITYAIDFGTSNTVITRWNWLTKEPEVINLGKLSLKLTPQASLVPSLIYVEDALTKQVLVGQEVRDQGLDWQNNPRFFAGFKRGIGATMQGFLPELDQYQLSFEGIGEWFLQGVIKELITQQQETPETLVLTVPVDSFESYRHWLTEVCANWSIPQVKMIDEPTAAALGYGALHQEIILVLDFGGGTTDFSLVKLPQSPQESKPQGLILKWGEKLLGNNAQQKSKIARVLAKAGKNLGGTDLDLALVDYFVETLSLQPSSLITRMCERLKIELSQSETATEVYFNDETFDSYELSLDRSTFESILAKQQFFSQLDQLMTHVLQQGRRQGVELEDIGAVLLVGGTAQIPAVQTWLSQYFPPEKIRSDRPFEAIAVGALQLGQELEVEDFLYHSYGIRYWNRRQNHHDWHTLIKAGQPFPLTKPVELILGASVPNQASIELVIGELGAETGGTEVYFDGDRLITKTLKTGETQVQPLNDQDGSRTLATLDPPGVPGSDRLKIEFTIDKNRILCITIFDLLTGETLVSNQKVVELS